MMKKKHGSTRTVYAILLLIVLYVVAYSVLFVVGPSHMGDDIAYAFFAHYVAIGTFVQSPGDILSVRILHIFPIGFFYALFGVGKLTSAAWDILSFALSTALAFLIGRELYDERVGLLAALIFAFFPLSAIYATTMSDNTPLMLFAGLAVFLLISAIRRNSKKWYLASGMALAAAPIVMPEGFVLWVIVGAFLILELLRRKISVNKTTLFFVYGFVATMALLLIFNYANAKSPLITFTSNIAYYGQTWRPDLQPMPLGVTLSFYPDVMFPYRIVNQVYGLLSGHGFDLQGILANENSVGFYFYAFVIAAMYLVVKRDRRAYILLFWFVAGIAYLEFGPQHIGLNPLTYELSHRLDRYLTLMAYPVAIIIAAALVAITGNSKGMLRKSKIAMCSLVVLFLIATAVPLTVYAHEVALAEQYPQLQAANYLGQLPNSTVIYADSGYGDLSVYMGFSNMSRFWYAYGGLYDCHSFQTKSYVLFPRYTSGLGAIASWPSTCGWALVLSPSATGLPPSVMGAAQSNQANLYYTNAVNSVIAK